MKYKVLFGLMFFCIASLAQDAAFNYHIQAQFANGFVWAHNKILKNVGGSKVNGVSIDFIKERTDENAKKYNRNLFSTGYSFSYYNLGIDTLGNSISFSYFNQPVLIKTKYFNTCLRLTGGFNYTNKPYNKITNATNYAYSSYINGFLALGLVCNISISQKSTISGLLSYNHFSNGGLHNPNLGVNFPTWQVGYAYQIGSKNKEFKESLQDEKWRFDMYGFGSNKSSPVYKDNRFWVYGGGIYVSRKLGLLSAFTLNAEYMNDLSNRPVLNDHLLFNNSSARVGTMIGHEFIFNKMIFSQQFGYYVFNETFYLNNFYHRWGLMYKFNKHILVGTNLVANAQKAQFLELRIAKSFYKN